VTIDGRSKRTVRPSGCAVCKNPLRQQIEIQRLGGASLDAIAAQYGFSRDSLFRHMRAHVSARRAAELPGAGDIDEMVSVAAKQSKSVVEYFSVIRSGLMELLLTAVSAGDRYGAAAVAGRLNENLRATASISGELRQAAGITVNNNLTLVTTPGFAELHQGLLNIIRNHPAAREDIVALLRSLDAPPQPPSPDGSRFVAKPVTIEGAAIEEMVVADAE
jgi:hypothetical protein